MNNTSITTPEEALSVLSHVIDHLPQSEQIFLDLRDLIRKQEDSLDSMTRQIVLYRNVGNDRAIEILRYISDAEFDGLSTNLDDIQEWNVFEDEVDDVIIIDKLKQYGYIVEFIREVYITQWGETALLIDDKIEKSGEPE